MFAISIFATSSKLLLLPSWSSFDRTSFDACFFSLFLTRGKLALSKVETSLRPEGYMKDADPRCRISRKKTQGMGRKNKWETKNGC